MVIDYELNKKQLATLEGLKFITPAFSYITNVDVIIQGRRIVAKYQPDTFSNYGKQFQNLVGISECHIDDEFDEEIGIRLAVSSLLKKTVDLSKYVLFKASSDYNKNVMATLVSIKESQTKLKKMLSKYSK